MARSSTVGVALGFVLVVLVQCAAAQTVHVVGDNMGWTVPKGGAGAAAYTNWASGKTFAVGDVLLFNFTTNEHDVLKVQKTSFDACTDSNPIGDIITTGPVNLTLDSAGDHFYICTISQHCQLGQKLAVSVSGTPGVAPPPTNTTTPTPTPTTPINPADCPTDAPASGPSGMNSPSIPPPPGSSSSKILAGVYMSMVAVIMGFFF